MRSATLILLFSVVALPGCPGGGASRSSGAKQRGDCILHSHSEGVEPLWIQQCPGRTEHLLVFCGESWGQTTSSQACAEAYADALGKLRRHIGQKIEAAIEPDDGGGYRFRIRGAESEGVTVRGVWEDQRWAEEYRCPEGPRHSCYAMITYPVMQYELLVKAAMDATQGRVLKALELQQEGREQVRQGKFGPAQGTFERALKLLEGLKEPVSLPGGENSALLAEQLAADLADAKGRGADTARTVLLAVRVMLDGRVDADAPAAQALQSRIKGWLTERGVHTLPGALALDELARLVDPARPEQAARIGAERGAGWVLAIDVRSDFREKADIGFVAYASGALRLLRTSDGREVSAANLPPRKFIHPMQQADAVQKALEKLREEALQQAVVEALARLAPGR